MKNYAYRVQNFSYNGFYGDILKKVTTYSATFIKWTRDPGIGLFKCSDNIERLIPTFALKGLKRHPLPEQDMTDKIIFGPPSHS